MAVPSRRLVVDASVASAAGASHRSYRTRDFLLEVLKVSHRIVMTASLSKEWDKHQSRFAMKWRAEMRSREKVVDIDEIENLELRTQVKMTKGVEKDLHLVEAALATDTIVVSLDDRAARDLCVEATKEVVWVNAAAEGGHAIYWMRVGANPVEKWKLGYRA